MAHQPTLSRLVTLVPLVVVVTGTLTHVAIAPTPAAPAPPPLAVKVGLPLERAQYFVGESVILAVGAVRPPYDLDWIDAGGRAAVSYRGDAPLLRVDTERLAPGRYQVVVNAEPTGVAIGLTSPDQASPAATLGRLAYRPNRPNDPDRFRTQMREARVNALMVERWGEAGSGTYPAQDDLVATGSALFLNPCSRLTGGFPCGVCEPEASAYRQRLALCAQANARYPTFGGFRYDADPAGFGDRKALLTAADWGEDERPLRNYLAAGHAALRSAFTAQSRLEPVSEMDHLRYCLAIGRAEFAPLADLPTLRWAQAVNRCLPPLSAADCRRLEERQDAWAGYLMGLYAEAYAGHQKVVREVSPSLRNTSAVNPDRAPAAAGQYPPSAYTPLDFRYSNPRTPATYPSVAESAWLFSTALLDIGRPADQPTWVVAAPRAGAESAPFTRLAARGLAYGARGMGPARDLIALSQRGTEAGADRTPGRDRVGDDLAAGRAWLRRFAPLAAQCAEVNRIAVLISRSQLARQQLRLGPDAPQFNVFVALARLGYTPRLITQEQIRGDGLRPFNALIVVNQTVEPPRPIMAKLGEFSRSGGRILVDRQTTVDLPDAEIMDIALPSTNAVAEPDCPVLGMPPSVTADAAESGHRALAAVLLEALGNADRSILRCRLGERSGFSTFELDGGPDATYVVAVREPTPGDRPPERQASDELVPRFLANGVLYDLTEEGRIGPVAPVRCGFDHLAARVYGLLRRPVKAVDLRANQSVTAGDELAGGLRFVGGNGERLRAAIPFHLAVRRPDGTVAREWYGCTDRRGWFVFTWRVPVNEPAGAWAVDVRSQLDGTTATVPVVVWEGETVQAEPVNETVVVRGTEPIRALLRRKPEFVLPVFPGPQETELSDAAETVRAVLQRQAVRVEVRENPAWSTYVMGYDPSRVQTLQNTLVAAGDTIGRVRLETLHSHDAYAPLSGYAFGKPLVLLDLAGTAGNPLVRKLDAEGLLWPRVGGGFPGPGRAVVQLVRSAFWPGMDTLVIQAPDVDGLRAAARALADLPPDWITPSVETARDRLLSGLGIGRAPPPAFRAQPLTARGRFTSRRPQPLAAHSPDVRLTAAETPPSAGGATAAPVPIPGEVRAEEAGPVVLVDGRPVEAAGVPLGDLRYRDASRVRTTARRGGPFRVVVEGIFRYSDRPPRSQPAWEEILAVYRAVVPAVRRPLRFDVLVDGKPAGQLTYLATQAMEVPLETLAASATRQPRSVREEVVTQVSGAVELPPGEHELLLIHQNIVDGQVDRIRLDYP
jgi:hypothetical protein